MCLSTVSSAAPLGVCLTLSISAPLGVCDVIWPSGSLRSTSGTLALAPPLPFITHYEADLQSTAIQTSMSVAFILVVSIYHEGYPVRLSTSSLSSIVLHSDLNNLLLTL